MAAASALAVAPGERRRLLVIQNPTSGRGRRSKSRLARVVEALEQRGCTVVLRLTRAKGDAERLARDAEPEFDAVVAAGGDGTVNEVANGLAAGRPLALIPLGTANVLAHEIGLPRDPRLLAAAIAAGPVVPVWPGRAGGRLFLMMAGVGFDAEVVRLVDAAWKRRLGKLAFLWPMLVAVRRYRPCEYVVRTGTETYRAAAVVVAKGHFYAGRFVLAPRARLAEPLFQIVLFQGHGRPAVLRYLAATALGIAHRLPDVTIAAARGLSIEAGACGRMQLDGEIAGPVPVAIEIAEAPLPLIHSRFGFTAAPL